MKPLIPPRKLIEHVGGGDFVKAGEEFRHHFIHRAALQPQERVLDVGCGCGRIAVALTTYLSGTGSYDGFDIDRAAIEWCQRHITPRYPHFRFQHANMHNEVYNPRGTIAAAGFPFPYADESFDFVCLTSVFTHMLWPDLIHYLREIRRVLRPGGRTLITFFLLNGESENLMDQGSSDLLFPYLAFNCRLAKANKPEWAVAFPENLIHSALNACQMKLRSPILYGRWAGRTEGLSYQDMVVATG